MEMDRIQINVEYKKRCWEAARFSVQFSEAGIWNLKKILSFFKY